ncbi:unnamed protein product, partial [Symbiodinium necroappetens]
NIGAYYENACERKNIPSWSGQPGTLRSWLKLLACWEAETTLHREKWGLRLYQSFPENSQPRKIADQIPMSELLSPSGYDLVLTAVMTKYRPYLDIAGPASVDKFFYSGDRSKGESFSNFIATKEIARQDLETNLGERLNDKVAGRILLRQAHLSDLQRELISLRDQSTLMGFDEVAAANAELGASSAKHYPVIYHDQVDNRFQNPGDEDQVGDESEEEDRTYDEEESTYLAAHHSAYADVRRDLKDRRKERGFIKHNKAPPQRPRSAMRPSSKGQGRGRSFRSRSNNHPQRKGGSKMVKGSLEVNFIVSRGPGGGQVFMMQGSTPWAHLEVRGYEAIVDTAAEDAVIGVTAMDALHRRGSSTGKRARCSIAVAGVHALLRFHVLRDGQFTTPPLLPISFLEAIGANIDLPSEKLSTPAGHSTSMTRLPSGHRTVPILDFQGRAWALPTQLRVAGRDPFQTSSSTSSWMASSMTTTQPRPSTSTRSSTNTTQSTPSSFGHNNFLGEYVCDSALRPSPTSSNLVAFRAGEEIEAKALQFLQESRWSMQDMEDLLQLLRPMRRDHFRNILGKPLQGEAFSAVFGAYAHGSFVGITKATTKYPQLVKYINCWVRQQVPEASFSSISIGANVRAPLHRDVNNDVCSKNITVSFGRHKGGALWIQDYDPNASLGRSKTVKGPQGQELVGSLVRQRADRLVANESKLSEGLPKKRLGVAKVEAAWKRLTVRILVMLATARQQMVVDEFYIVDSPPEDPKEKASSSHEAKPKRRATKNSHINQGIGQPLARSKAHKTFAVEPQACQHPPDKLRCRANAIFQWWTCTLCGSRWQRNDTVETTNDPLPKTSENEPKIMGRRGQEFPKFLPAKGFHFGVFQRDGWDRIDSNTFDENTAADHVDNRKVTFSHEDDIARDTDDSTPQEELNAGSDGDLRDQLGRGDTIGRGNGTPRQTREVRPRVLLDAASITASSPTPLRKLRKELQSQGWMVKTLLLLITWAGNDWSKPLPSFLGPPRLRMDWSTTEQEWMTHSEAPSTSSRPTTWCCYVFEDKMQKFNWVLDSSGHQVPNIRDKDVKAINKATRENLVTQGKFLVGATPVKEIEVGAVGHAVDLHLGWDFNREEHRRGKSGYYVDYVPKEVDIYYKVQSLE